MVLNGSIIEYEDYGNLDGLVDVIRLSGGAPDWSSLKPTYDIQQQNVAYKMLRASARYSERAFDINQRMDREDREERRQAMYGTAAMATVAHAAMRRKSVKRPLPGSAGEHPGRKPFNNQPSDIPSDMPWPIFNNQTNSSGYDIPMDITNGGPGQQTRGNEAMRLASSQIMSTDTRFQCTSYSPKTGGRNTYRRKGYDQPLFMEINGPFQALPNLVVLPLTSVSGNVMNIGAVCFNLQWPGTRMHEDTSTKNSANTDKYAVWNTLVMSSYNRTVNVDFGKVLANEYWRKMVIGNVHLRLEFHNHSVNDHMIHIIWYTNKRKGIKYVNEFSQWIMSIEAVDEPNRQLASDFFQRGKLPQKPPCKILRHKMFVLKAQKPMENFGGLSNNNYNHGNYQYKSGGQRKVVKMKSTSGYTLKRGTLGSITPQTTEDAWLESTEVEEERMIFCQILACPVRQRVRMLTLNTQSPSAGTAGDQKIMESANGFTLNTGTFLQQIDEDYRSYEITGTPAEFTPIPGIEVDIQRKVYFKVDKEIELS